MSSIPFHKTIAGDLETPVSLFYKIKKPSEPAYLLESVEQGEKIGRYSFLGTASCSEIIHAQNEDPLKKVTEYLKKWERPAQKDLPPFNGGVVGWIAYEAARHFDTVKIKNRCEITSPSDGMFLPAEQLYIFDHLRRNITLIANCPSGTSKEEGEARLKKMESAMKKPLPEQAHLSSQREKSDSKIPIESTMEKEKYCKAVEELKEHIRAGDIFQAVLSQRLSRPYLGDPFLLYRTLRQINPSPYMFYFDNGEFQLVGSSPEILFQLKGKEAAYRPIAGTRKRGKDEAEDQALEKELLADKKECAEHIMLVDLGRNDMGRVCCPGSIRVTDKMVVERYSHVMHIVSHIKGKLRDGLRAEDLLRATFPAGTVSGAPKIKAMELIDQLEPKGRGPYAGALGYFSYDGNADFCITIRTLMIHQGQAFVQAGAGIVYDSIPEKENEECWNKAIALLKTLEET